MKKLIDYLYFRKSLYIFSFLFVGNYWLILSLYHTLSEAIIYATVLSLSLLFIYFIFDFYHFYKKSTQLQYVQELPQVYISDLPLPSSSIEDQYQQLLEKTDNLHKQLETERDYQYDEMIDYFTLWVHQIKTPISALRLLIQSQELSQNELLIQILKIEQYVDMVLHYIKVSHMEADLKLKYYDLGSIVNDVLKKQATFFIHKKIKLIFQPIERKILTDEKWISFVIEQILSNALKYTKEGSITIYEEDEVLYIKDTGIGIKEEDLPRLFERGFTGYNGRLDKKASGLGLYLCQQIIKNLGYSMRIQSTLGEGTVVSINFHVEQLHVE